MEQLTRKEAEAQQQLRQKVDVLVFDDATAHHIFVFQEEELQSSEREKLSKNRELADALQQLRQKVSIDIVTVCMGHHVPCRRQS